MAISGNLIELLMRQNDRTFNPCTNNEIEVFRERLFDSKGMWKTIKRTEENRLTSAIYDKLGLPH